jgi:hypothetical protein
VGEVSNKQAEPNWCGAKHLQPQSVGGFVRILPCHDSVWVWPLAHERFKLSLERCEVFVRPIQFQKGLA